MTAPRSEVTAIVLAGGRSSRFGAQKLAADLGGAPLLEHAVRGVAAVTSVIVIAGAAAKGAPPAGSPSSGDARVRVVPDRTAFAGPLSALHDALGAVETELAIVTGGDMPSPVATVLDAMLDRLTLSPDVDAVVLHDGARRQPLPLAIRVGPGRSAAVEAMHSGDRSLVRFLDRLRCAEVPAAEWRALDADGRTLVDVDLPADLDRLRGGEIH